MKLSIITVNLNNARGLQKTIESVVEQTWLDFELIIVDGASTDGSIEVIQHFNNSMIQQFHWLSEPDSGVYQAMNKGIRMAKGEYLLFLNSGDFLVDDRVLTEVFSINRTADILCGRCDVSENGKVVWTSNPPDLVTFGKLYNVGLAHQSTFIKRSLFDKLGLYREDFKYNSDIDFWYRSIILNGATTEKVDLVVSDYNLDGFSSKEHQTPVYKNEMSEILSQANFDKFIPDYIQWKEEKKSMQIYYWAKQKKTIDFILKTAYKIALWKNKKI